MEYRPEPSCSLEKIPCPKLDVLWERVEGLKYRDSERDKRSTDMQKTIGCLDNKIDVVKSEMLEQLGSVKLQVLERLSSIQRTSFSNLLVLVAVIVAAVIGMVVYQNQIILERLVK